MLGKDKLFARAKAAIDKPKPQILVYTPELEEYIGAPINTPMGEGRIKAIAYAYSRRVGGNTLRLYTLTIEIVDKQYTVTTYEHTQWAVQ